MPETGTEQQLDNGQGSGSEKGQDSSNVPASFDRVAIIGAGLLGSSVALAIRDYGMTAKVVMADRDEAVLSEAKALGIGDEWVRDAGEAVRWADLVIACVPVGAMDALMQSIAPCLQDGAIITDVGSVKGSVCKAMQAHLPESVHIIPGHPVAGSERSGPGAGYSSLFENRWCILTPPEGANADAVARLSAFWERFGAHLEVMNPEHHDLVLAITSHLPHLIAYNIVGTANDLETVTKSEVIKFSAGGFRDFTRIAASDPIMWRDVFLNNREAVLEMLGRFSEDLSMLQRAIRWGDGDKLQELFTHTRNIRRSIVDAGQDTDEPDFGRVAGLADTSAAGQAETDKS